MDKTQVLAIVCSLILGSFVCAGILALTLGTASSMFWPTLVASITVVAIVVVLTQNARKRQ
ncbi:hypothetical protein ARTHRO8AJ_290010 [Arthrobacter sp. 8AJ]|nr:hypothetical protein ARTHRO8AJ_290010 [Arthrobacter sp. 8AJ]